jgi:hypothetical protein
MTPLGVATFIEDAATDHLVTIDLSTPPKQTDKGNRSYFLVLVQGEVFRVTVEREPNLDVFRNAYLTAYGDNQYTQEDLTKALAGTEQGKREVTG